MSTRWLEKTRRYEGDPKSGPPPGPSLAANQTAAAETRQDSGATLLLLSEADPKSGPPPTDNFYPEQTSMKSAFIDTPKFGIAMGTASALLFLLMTLVVTISGMGSVLDFLKLMLPGFQPDSVAGVFWGVLGVFVMAYILGLIIAMIYNTLLRHHFREYESWEVFG